MAIRVAINGFGRIGRSVFRIMSQSKEFDIVAINDIGSTECLLHLLKYDTVMGRFPQKLEFKDNELHCGGYATKFVQEKNLDALPWKDLGVDFVIESTGIFRKKSELERHLNAGAAKVLLTVPAKDAIDATIVLGVNDGDLKGEHRIISNASCTTNCLAPMAKVIHDNWGIKRGYMTTIHAYTNDQRLLDLPHSDLRRARAAAQNVIPTTTGAAKAVGEVIPTLKGKMDGIAIRVPVANGSVVDLVAELNKDTTPEEINKAMKAASEGPMKGILEYCTDPIVSSDVIGNTHSSVFDALSTSVMGGSFVKLISWYDNEWGYSSRVVDLIAKAHKLGR